MIRPTDTVATLLRTCSKLPPHKTCSKASPRVFFSHNSKQCDREISWNIPLQFLCPDPGCPPRACRSWSQQIRVVEKYFYFLSFKIVLYVQISVHHLFFTHVLVPSPTMTHWCTKENLSQKEALWNVSVFFHPLTRGHITRILTDAKYVQGDSDKDFHYENTSTFVENMYVQ